MANTNYVLSKIKIEGALQDVLANTNGEHVTVTYENKETTLTSALASIIAKIAAVPTSDNVDSKISAAIDGLIDGAPETYDTLKEIATYISEHEEVVTALNNAIGTKVDKEDGKGLSAEDFTTALKTKLDNLPEITSTDVSNWNNKADKSVATTTANGLMSAADKTRLDGIRGVRFGTEVPADLQDGELFIAIVSE
jgi:hypothetical protein